MDRPRSSSGAAYLRDRLHSDPASSIGLCVRISKRAAKLGLQEIWMAETRNDATSAFDAFVELA